VETGVIQRGVLTVIDHPQKYKILKTNKMIINKIERPQTVIKVLITPITTEVKAKTSNAIQSFINKVKEKHLS
jgi:predicted phage tail protein